MVWAVNRQPSFRWDFSYIYVFWFFWKITFIRYVSQKSGIDRIWNFNTILSQILVLETSICSTKSTSTSRKKWSYSETSFAEYLYAVAPSDLPRICDMATSSEMSSVLPLKNFKSSKDDWEFPNEIFEICKISTSTFQNATITTGDKHF